MISSNRSLYLKPTPPMFWHIKDRWVNALRSGKFSQGRGALKDGDTYCCLGVLCELAVEEGITVRQPSKYGSSMIGYRDDAEWSTLEQNKATGFTQFSVLPAQVAEWAGIQAASPVIRKEGEPGATVSLAGLNDGGVPFEKIAELIDWNL